MVSFDQSNNIDAIDVKIDGSVLDEISSFEMLAFLICIGALTFSLLLKLPPIKLEP